MRVDKQKGINKDFYRHFQIKVPRVFSLLLTYRDIDQRLLGIGYYYQQLGK